ncbi:MAG: hypothetical protein ABWK00_07105, partial [Desulfurococcaceae archaeon]
YGDVYELGIRLWRCGFKLAYVPLVVGRHYRSATVRSLNDPIFEHWDLRSEISVRIMCDGAWHLKTPMLMAQALALSMLKRNKHVLRGLIDGIINGFKLRDQAVVKSLRNSMRREPRVRIPHKMPLLLRFYIRWRGRASKMFYITMCRFLGKFHGQQAQGGGERRRRGSEAKASAQR